MGLLVDLRSSPDAAPVIAQANAAFAGAFTATAAVTDFGPNAARSYATFEGWRPNAADASLTVSFTSAQTIDYIGVVCIGAVSTTTVRASTSTNGVTFVDRGAAQDAGQGAILWLLDSLSSITEVRMRVQNGNVSGFRLAVLMAGQRTTMQRNIYVGHTPITYGRTTEITSNRSESGQFLGRVVRRRSLGTSITMSNLTPTFYRNTLDPVLRAMEEQPAFWSWRPEAAFDNEVAYAWASGDAQVVNQRPNGMMQVSFDLNSGPFA